MASAKPGFFVVGAPKCGTTSLAAWLDEHPEVCLSRPKEPHYFSPNRFRPFRSLAEYERCFSHARPEHKAVGEASTHTMYFPEAIERILDYQPQAKFIACLRNPLDMLISLHNMVYYSAEHDIADLGAAWTSDAEIFPHYVEEPIRVAQVYRWVCSLGTHYARLKELVPEGRLLPVLLEDLVADEARVLRRVTDFLAVSPSAAPFPKKNEKKLTRSRSVSFLGRRLMQLKRGLGIERSLGVGVWMQNLNTVRGEGVARLTPETRAMLAEHFAPETRKLEQALGRDLSHWRTPTLTGSES